MPESKPSIVTVVGSLNIDYLSSVTHLPAPGDTVAASQLHILFGGKGANQAIAAARQGAKVRFIGSVGDDDTGRSYLDYLTKQKIDTGDILQRKNITTGSAMIAVDQKGENMIVVAAGANAEISPDDIRKAADQISTADILVLQFEIPLASVITAIKIANETKVPVVLNPSPILDEFPWGELIINYLVVNAGEAEVILGMPITSSADRSKVQSLLAKLKIENLIVTRGSKSTLTFTGQTMIETPTLSVSPVDTVGAGDAFCGTFAARLAESPAAPLSDLVMAANCAGALTTLSHGAQDPIPDRPTTDAKLQDFQAL